MPDGKIEGQTVYRYEFLLGGLVAYLDRNPHMRTALLVNASLDNAELTLPGSGAGLDTRMLEIGEETLRDDLRWLFMDLNTSWKSTYEEVPSYRFAIMQSDTFVFPLPSGARAGPAALLAEPSRRAQGNADPDIGDRRARPAGADRRERG
jgi:hypothetical protein